MLLVCEIIKGFVTDSNFIIKSLKIVTGVVNYHFKTYLRILGVIVISVTVVISAEFSIKYSFSTKAIKSPDSSETDP